MADNNSRQTVKGHNLPKAPSSEKFASTVAAQEALEHYNKERSLPDPCGDSELSKINTQLSKFFIAVKGLKKYGELYVNGTINKLSNITSLIRQTSQLIGAVLKTLINRLRDFIIDTIRKAIESLIDGLLPTIAKAIKNTIVQKIIDEIFCRFKDIIAGLANLVTDFLFELVGKIVNVPFCAAQQFTNALINNIAAIVDNAIGPLLDEINDVLGGITEVVGSVFEALDFILGFEAFLCAKPNCPEIKSFKASPWGGPTQSQIDSFNNFKPSSFASEGIGSVNDYIDNIEIFGSRLGDSAGSIPSSITDCNTNPLECGPPRVEIFGGGGFGAVGEAVVDNIGRTIGVNLRFGGSGYTRPPFVSFIDNCEDTFTSGYAEINDRGQVTNIVMTTTPVAPPRNGRTEFDDPSDTFTGGVQEGNDYIVCLVGFRILSTGIGYTVEDSILIDPDIANIDAVVKLTEFGQIIDIQLADIVCGLSGYPTISINSLTGNGAVIEPILSFIPIQEINDSTNISDISDFISSVGVGDIGTIGIGTDIGADTGIDAGISGRDETPFIQFDAESVILGEIASNNTPGVIRTLRGRNILTERQEFNRRDLIRIVDCIS